MVKMKFMIYRRLYRRLTLLEKDPLLAIEVQDLNSVPIVDNRESTR